MYTITCISIIRSWLNDSDFKLLFFYLKEIKIEINLYSQDECSHTMHLIQFCKNEVLTNSTHFSSSLNVALPTRQAHPPISRTIWSLQTSISQLLLHRTCFFFYMKCWNRRISMRERKFVRMKLLLNMVAYKTSAATNYLWITM